MEHTTCHIIYCDNRTERDATITRADLYPNDRESEGRSAILVAPEEVKHNLEMILKVSEEVYLCQDGLTFSKCLRRLGNKQRHDTPIVVFLDIDPRSNQRGPTSQEALLWDNAEMYTGMGHTEQYGLGLLKHLTTEVYTDDHDRVIVTVAIIRREGHQSSEMSSWSDKSKIEAYIGASELSPLIELPLVLKCLDAGALEVIVSPLGLHNLQQIATVTYKAHLQLAKKKQSPDETKRARKRSWLGIEEKPSYAYLRESMVSSLMDSICRPEIAANPSTEFRGFDINPERKARICHAVGSWHFSAHDFTDDELMYAAFLMFSHCLQMPELDKWSISDQKLHNFLAAARAAYNSFVLYHNFRHVVDVLQALFFSLLQIGALPRYSTPGSPRITSFSPITKLLGPLDTLVLLVSAIGHDVGHPGVNNAFLVTLKAPLAQLYNDKSVLEAFHCAAYSQILRRYWESTYKDVEFRRLLINTILATDMGVHPDYMADLGNLQEKLHHSRSVDSWSAKLTQSNKDLILGLLIKCADISNVARPFSTAAQWAEILQHEFARQGEMERDIGINSTLFGGPPELGNLQKLANSQIGFMNFFGLPLFEGVADIIPELRFTVEEILKNKIIWEAKIKDDRKRVSAKIKSHGEQPDGEQSPRSSSPNNGFAVRIPEQLGQSDVRISIAGSTMLDSLENGQTKAAKGSITIRSQIGNNFSAVNDDMGIKTHGSDSDPAQQISVDTVNQRTSHNRLRGSGGQNFSRPYSSSHYAQVPCLSTTPSSTSNMMEDLVGTLQSDPSADACPTYPRIDGESDALATPTDQLDRPSTGNSNMGGLTESNSRASIIAINEPAEGNQVHPRSYTSDSGGNKSHGDPFSRDSDGFHQVKRKSSRWKFDFWRRKKQNEKEGQVPEGLIVSPRPRVL